MGVFGFPFAVTEPRHSHLNTPKPGHRSPIPGTCCKRSTIGRCQVVGRLPSGEDPSVSGPRGKNVKLSSGFYPDKILPPVILRGRRQVVGRLPSGEDPIASGPQRQTLDHRWATTQRRAYVQAYWGTEEDAQSAIWKRRQQCWVRISMRSQLREFSILPDHCSVLVN